MEKTFYPRPGRCPLSQFIFNTVVEVLARVIKEEKKKSILERKEQNYLHVRCRDHIWKSQGTLNSQKKSRKIRTNL